MNIQDNKTRRIQEYTEQNLIANAIHLAFKYHDGQMYGDRPYREHLMDVKKSVEENYTGDIPMYKLIIVALLHDIIEDTNVTVIELHPFGKDIFEAILAITKVNNYTYKNDYLSYITTVRANEMALIVKQHDTLCNLRVSVKDNETKRIVKYSTQLADLYK